MWKIVCKYVLALFFSHSLSLSVSAWANVLNFSLLWIVYGSKCMISVKKLRKNENQQAKAYKHENLWYGKRYTHNTHSRTVICMCNALVLRTEFSRFAASIRKHRNLHGKHVTLVELFFLL